MTTTPKCPRGHSTKTGKTSFGGMIYACDACDDAWTYKELQTIKARAAGKIAPKIRKPAQVDPKKVRARSSAAKDVFG